MSYSNCIQIVYVYHQHTQHSYNLFEFLIQKNSKNKYSHTERYHSLKKNTSHLKNIINFMTWTIPIKKCISSKPLSTLCMNKYNRNKNIQYHHQVQIQKKKKKKKKNLTLKSISSSGDEQVNSVRILVAYIQRNKDITNKP